MPWRLHCMSVDTKRWREHSRRSWLPLSHEDRPRPTRAFAEHFPVKTARYEVEARIIRDAETLSVQLAGRY